MGVTAILSLLGPLFQPIINKLFPDPKEAAEAEAKIREIVLNAQIEENRAKAIENESKKEIIVTEMNQTGWFSDWRAKLMTMCTIMIGFNWILVPLLNSLLYFLGTQITPNAIPSEAWLLLNVGLGGYIGEKTMATYQQGKVEKAKAENPIPVIDETAFADALRKSIFKDGMTETQWKALQKAARESVRHE